MSTPDDLFVQLRDWANVVASSWRLSQDYDGLELSLREAADRIEAQAKEIARLHYLLGVIDDLASGIRSEADIALRSQHVTEDGTP